MTEIYLINEDSTLKESVLYNQETNQYYSENFEWVDLNYNYTNIKPQRLIKPKWAGTEWIEGASEEEIAEWQAQQDITPQPTELELLQQENVLLKAQVNALNESQTFLEDCLVEVGQVIYA